MYLSFEAPSIEAIGSKVSKTEEGPILEAMEPAAITMPEDGEPLEEIAPTHEEGAQPTSVDTIPDQSSSLLDE
jgi:hypothetical protein